MPNVALKFLYDLPGCVLVDDVGCCIPLDVLPPHPWSGDQSTVLSVDEVRSALELVCDGLGLLFNVRVWDYILQEVQNQVVWPIRLDVKDDFHLSL